MKHTNTFQTRLRLDPKSAHTLDQCVTLLSKVERQLFQDITAGKDLNHLKRTYLKNFQITARQFNACRVQIEGKIASIKESNSLRITNQKERIHSLEKKLKTLKNKQKIHQKKRKLKHLQHKLHQLEKDQSQGKVRLCFGGKKLFRAQFHLEENCFKNHQEWKQQWESKRNGEFFLLGSKDETAGNQSCALHLNDDESFTLRLRLPDALNQGKYLTLSNIHIKYGHSAIQNSLMSCLERKATQNKKHGQALSYLFKKDQKGWRLFVSTDLKEPQQITREDIGAIGIDINANHIACVETDRFGNPLQKRTFPLNTYGKTKNQSLALIGDTCSQIVTWAENLKKPLIIEKLDFKKKKANLKEQNSKKRARQLSSFCYQRILQTLTSRAFRKGVCTHSVNPAYTSQIGEAKFALKYGLSKHHAAALSIARRHYGFSENPPKSKEITISDGKESKLTLLLPEWNRSKHVWHFWGRYLKKVRAALAEHFRTMKHRSTGPPQVGPCDDNTLDLVGAIPACESLA